MGDRAKVVVGRELQRCCVLEGVRLFLKISIASQESGYHRPFYKFACPSCHCDLARSSLTSHIGPAAGCSSYGVARHKELFCREELIKGDFRV